MSDKEAPPKKKKKGKILLFTGLLLAVGGGGAAAAYFTGGTNLLAASHSTPQRDLPKLVLREGVSEGEAVRYFSSTGDKRVDPTKFQPSYDTLGDHFTSNLRDGGGFVQVGLGVSTYYDERVLENVKLHQMAVRSAVLLTLSEQDSAVIGTGPGKQALREALRKSINDVLKKKEGFGGIDDVHFTSFVVQ